jgi:hypothetical protein
VADLCLFFRDPLHGSIADLQLPCSVTT